MRFQSFRLHQLDLPFRFLSRHAGAEQGSSDSVLLALRTVDLEGWGEAVIREYVGGRPGGGGPILEAAEDTLRRFLGMLEEADGWPAAAEALSRIPCEAAERPLLCALEGAILDIECRRAGTDVYGLLGREPLRDRVVYSAVLPMLPADQAGELVARIRDLGLPALRVKLGRDAAANDEVLALCRKVLGEEPEIRADANSSWTADTVSDNLEVCLRHRVSSVEDPGSAEVIRAVVSGGVAVAADETFATEEDLERIAAEGVCRLLNIRLAKNGGLLRALAMAQTASLLGVEYWLGSHVGETGILSALGRVASSLLPSPRYTDGSYDAYVLADNVTRVSYGFGPGGVGPIVRGDGPGYEVDPAKVARYAPQSLEAILR